MFWSRQLILLSINLNQNLRRGGMVIQWLPPSERASYSSCRVWCGTSFNAGAVMSIELSLNILDVSALNTTLHNFQGEWKRERQPLTVCLHEYFHVGNKPALDKTDGYTEQCNYHVTKADPVVFGLLLTVSSSCFKYSSMRFSEAKKIIQICCRYIVSGDST